MLKSPVVFGNNLGPLGDEFGVKSSLNDFLDNGFFVDRTIDSFTDFKHERPLFTRLGNIQWRVLGEYSDTVKGTIVFGKVHPALALESSGTFSFQAQSHNVSTGVPELGSQLGKARESFSFHHLAHGIEWHGGNDIIVIDFGSIGKRQHLFLGINSNDSRVETDIVGVDELVETLPNGSSTSLEWESESSVGSVMSYGEEQKELKRLKRLTTQNTNTKPFSQRTPSRYHLLQ